MTSVKGVRYHSSVSSLLWLLIALDCATLRPFVVETIAPALHARAEMATEHLPSGVGQPKRHVQPLRRPYTNSLTPSPLSICSFRHPTRGYVQLQWYVPIAAPLACIPIYVMSPRTSLAPSVHWRDVLSTSSNLQLCYRSHRILLHVRPSGGRGR